MSFVVRFQSNNPTLDAFMASSKRCLLSFSFFSVSFSLVTSNKIATTPVIWLFFMIGLELIEINFL